MSDTATDLSGKLLIAMPGMTDPRFQKSVIFLCAHSDDGAMGLVINHPAKELTFPGLLEQLSIYLAPGQLSLPDVHLGGPVENARGFVLHSAEYEGTSGTLKVDDRFGMTATLDILEDIAHGTGPNSCLLALGYSGWGPGQIESELQQNAWLVGEANEQIVFSGDSDAKWAGALALMGIDPFTLSGAAGRA